MLKLTIFIVIFIVYNSLTFAMEKKPYHHLPDGTFRNPEGSPERNSNFKWSFRTYNKEKKKLDMTVPEDHVVEKAKVLSDLERLKYDDYIGWIGHATFLIKLGNTTIITDPVFSKNAGPLFFGPKRYTEPALKLNEIPKTDLFLLTHNHYDHQDMRTITRFPFKKSKVLLPLKLGKYFTRNGYRDVNEMDWYDKIEINKIRKINDDIYMIKYDCCYKCWAIWVEKREERWQSGWRPNEEDKKQRKERIANGNSTRNS